MVFNITKWCGQIMKVDMSKAETVIHHAKTMGALKVVNDETGEVVYEKENQA